MDRNRPRKAAAFLLVATFALAVTPAAAAPPSSRGAAEPVGVTALFDAMAGWLDALWPGSGVDGSAAAWAAVGAQVEHKGGMQPGSAADAGGEPTSDPERGSGLDPDG